MSKQKGGRSTNMTLAEKDLLIDLALKHRSKTDAVSARQKEEGLRVLAAKFRAESASIVHRNGQQLKCVSCLYVLGSPTIYRIGRIGPLRMGGVCIKTTGLTIASITQNFNCVCVAQLILDYRDTLPKSRYSAMTRSYSKLIRIVKD